MHTKTFAVLMLVLAAAVAGCSGKSGSASGGDGSLDGVDPFVAGGAGAKDAPKATATASTGIIRGVVVDEAIHPVAKAHVIVTGTKLAANTTAAGAFAFDGLKAGTYFLQVRKLGYDDAQTSAEVQVGVADPASVKVQLLHSANFVPPSFTVNEFKGYIECSVGTPLYLIQACGIANDESGQEVTQSDYSHLVGFDKPPTFIQGEIVWTSTQPLGDTFQLAIRQGTEELHAQGQYVEGGDINATVGSSPLKFIVTQDQIDHFQLGQGGNKLQLDVFGSNQVCAAADACVAGATVQQQFQVITHTFYGFRPPATWRFSVDGDPPMPT